MTGRKVFLTALFLAAIFSVPGCIDRGNAPENGSIANKSSASLLPYYTLAQTKTTLIAVKDDIGLEEISRLLESGRLDDALAASEKNASLEVLVYLNNAGVNYTKEKRYEEADKIFTSILRIEPRQPDIWYNKGLVDIDLGRQEEAAAAFGNATELRPEDAGAWYQLASSLYYLKRYEEAFYACNRSLVLEPGNAYAWYNKGIVLTELKRYNESIDAYDHALKIRPDYFEAENNKANALSEMGRYEEALSSYDRALAVKADEQTKKNRDIAEAKLKESGKQ